MSVYDGSLETTAFQSGCHDVNFCSAMDVG